jgi:predicted dinucleotide-binding enzyme
MGSTSSAAEALTKMARKAAVVSAFGTVPSEVLLTCLKRSTADVVGRVFSAVATTRMRKTLQRG